MDLQLHIFVDASKEAYACVVYFRAESVDGIEVTLIGEKVKVGPLKALSIPRLELMAAVIEARLLKTIRNGHLMMIVRTTMWSDLKTVLTWIDSDYRCYRQFVACRVGEILSKSDAAQWRWVSTKENPSDLAMKWGKDPCLLPIVIGSADQTSTNVKPTNETMVDELRACLVHTEATEMWVVDWQRFSDWNRLLRSVAYVHRFRTVQSEQYPAEMAVLSKELDENSTKSGRLKRASKIRTLSPYMDCRSFFRRLTQSPDCCWNGIIGDFHIN